jgi:hypothetical protein
MLRNVAALGGVELEDTTLEHLEPTTPAVFRLHGRPGPLQGEMGRHRAQYVPASSTTGRIMTAQVVVELIPPANDAPTDPSILKTYNYVLKRATRHPSGRTATLEEALAGRL